MGAYINDNNISIVFFAGLWQTTHMNERNTKQKRIVAEVIEQAARPLTIPEVHALAQKKLPKLGIATVYREIARLSESGEIHSVAIPGDPLRYEKTAHHHHHFKCTGCNTVFELEGCLKNVTRLMPKGFTHQSHDITLYGLCRKCG